MKQKFSGTVPKDLGWPDSNEDKLAFSDDGKRLALCDGASESYNSKLWANMLAQGFVDDPRITSGWVSKILSEYYAHCDIQNMTWSQMSAFERGSFATLVGVEYSEEHNAVDVVAIGDSIVLLFDSEVMVRSWPFENVECFQEKPTLLATVAGHNEFVGANNFWTVHSITMHLDHLVSPQLVCMTDALGEWALREALSGGERLAELLSVRAEAELTDLVLREREEKRMRIDDSTLVILSF